ncbi:MAG: DNA-binding protein [Symploca sp. SIO1A3]|nr:DNA-binding protein [Symploca sp. SIO1A3]
MPRSLKVDPRYIKQVKSALQRNRFARQRDLAEELQLSLATVSNFLNGKPVDYLNFYEICSKLGLDEQEIADFDSSSPSKGEDTEPHDSADTDLSNYVERPPIESRCWETILQPGALLRLKASRRMGKTSLIDWILVEAGKHNYRTVSLSLLLADVSVTQGLDEFLRWFCVAISRQLGLPADLDDYWEEGLGSSYNCTLYFEEHLLSQIDNPLVLALDEVDQIFATPFAGYFLGMLRAWYEKAKTHKLWQKLRLIVAHATEAYIPLDINQSPFNVGVPIELPEFTPEQVKDLAQQQQLAWDLAQVKQLMSLLGGHPYRVQRVIYFLKNNQQINLTELLETASTESGIFSSHLRGHLLNLRQYPELATAMKQVVEATSPIQLESTQAFKLQSLGLVILEGNYVKPRCNLYSQYFRDRL